MESIDLLPLILSTHTTAAVHFALTAAGYSLANGLCTHTHTHTHISILFKLFALFSAAAAYSLLPHFMFSSPSFFSVHFISKDLQQLFVAILLQKESLICQRCTKSFSASFVCVFCSPFIFPGLSCLVPTSVHQLFCFLQSALFEVLYYSSGNISI